MDAFQAIASMKDDQHFTDVLSRPEVALLPAKARASLVAAARQERTRILTLMALSGVKLEPLLLQAFAHGWSAGEFAAALRTSRTGTLQAAARRTGVLSATAREMGVGRGHTAA